jgi:hypothetical protein
VLDHQAAHLPVITDHSVLDPFRSFRVPKKWLEKLAMRREITELADRLLEAHRL